MQLCPTRSGRPTGIEISAHTQTHPSECSPVHFMLAIVHALWQFCLTGFRSLTVSRSHENTHTGRYVLDNALLPEIYAEFNEQTLKGTVMCTWCSSLHIWTQWGLLAPLQRIYIRWYQKNLSANLSLLTCLNAKFWRYLLTTCLQLHRICVSFFDFVCRSFDANYFVRFLA